MHKMSHKQRSEAYSIIREVKKHPALWDPDYKYYNDRVHVGDSWRKITDSLKMPENQIRTKWKNLRDTFLREMKKCNVDTVQEYDGKWQYFNAIKFIRQKRDEEYLATMASNRGEQNAQTADSESDIGSETEHEVPVKKQKLSEDDYDLMFLKSLAPYLREMANDKKLTVRNKLQEMMLNELLQQKSSQHSDT